MQNHILNIKYNQEKKTMTSNVPAQGSSPSLNDSRSEYSRKNRILLMIFAAGVVGFLVLIYNRPSSEEHVFDGVSFPPTAQQLYKLSKVLVKYMDAHFSYTVFAFFYLYILLQAFAIPGPIFLCLLSPTLYGPVPAFFICLTCSCLGSSLCFFMSITLAKQLVIHRFNTLFTKFNQMVSSNKHNLLWYMLFLRFTPLIPNWFVNLASPLVGIPYVVFLTGSAIGLIPMNFILIQTGQTLKEIESIGLKMSHFITLFALGTLSLIPTFIGKKYEKKLQARNAADSHQESVKMLDNKTPVTIE